MTAAFAYDALQYPALIFPQMHPSRLAAIGRLHGLASASPIQCRLLEVGCGDGLQLLSLALAYPQAQFVGVDMSQTAIARGEAMRQQLGLTNLQLHAADVCQWECGATPFDYIVAHGFFSWVPASVQDTLLALCQRMLTANGIAYISYNALPGCHLRRMMWDMLQQHTSSINEPLQKIAQAHEFLAWLQASVTTKTPYADVVRHEVQDLLEKTESAVFYHDDLAELNLPYSITDFAARAHTHGLGFLAEAEYHDSSGASLPDHTAASLAQLAAGDVIRREQYLDYLKGRRFRQTLLCRQEVAIVRPAQADAVLQMQATGHLYEDTAFADTDIGKAHPGLRRFCASGGAALTTPNALVASALTAIGNAFPCALSVDTLLQQHLATTQGGGNLHENQHENLQEIRGTLCKALLIAFEYGLLTLHIDAPAFANSPSEYPCLNPLSRVQLENGQDMLTSLRPSMVRLDSQLGLELVKLLNGKRDRIALLQALVERMQAFPAVGADGKESIQTSAWWQDHLAGQLESGLQLACKMALLDA